MDVLAPLLCPAGPDVEGGLEDGQGGHAEQDHRQDWEVAPGDQLELGGLHVDGQGGVVHHGEGGGDLNTTDYTVPSRPSLTCSILFPCLVNTTSLQLRSVKEK